MAQIPDLRQAGSVPPFSSEEMEADWWDTHETSGLPTEPCPDRTDAGPERITLTLRLSAAEVAALENQAKRHGLNWKSYVRVLVNQEALHPKR